MTAGLAELGASVDRHPREVADRAAEVAREARAAGEYETAAIAATTLARARRNLGEYELAERAIDEAIELGIAIGGDVLADAHLVAASVALFRKGSGRTAFHLTEAERHGSPAMQFDVRIQRAVIAEREGRFDEALTAYDSILAGFHGDHDAIIAAQVLTNRGKLNVLRGQPTRALTDFAAAREVFEREGQDFLVILVIENAAWAMTTIGDIPTALKLLDEAASLAVDHDHRLQQAAVSRAEALMAAGLFTDAFDALEPAVLSRRTEGDRAGLAVALLLQAEASRLARLADGIALAELARDLFRDLGAVGWERQARLEVLRARRRRGEDDASALVEAERLAVDLAGSGQARTEVDAWNLATELAVSLGDLERAERAAANCAERAATIPFVEHRLAATHAAASVHAAAGRFDEALEDVTDILREFDEYRGAIGSPDARSASILHAGSLYTLGGWLAATTGDAARILTWSEQRRQSVTIWGGGALPRSDNHARTAASTTNDGAHDPAAELRTVLSALRQAEITGTGSSRDPGELRARRAELEDELRDGLLRRGGATAERDSWAAVTAAHFAGHVGVSIDVHADRLLAVVIEGGSLRIVDLGEAASVFATADAASRLVTRAAQAAGTGTLRPAVHRQLQDAIARLDRLVVTPLELSRGPVVLAMPAELHPAPLAATCGLFERAVTLVPSLGWWASVPGEPQRRFDRIVSIAGPRLAWAETEAHAVAAVHPGTRLVTGADARADAVLTAFMSSDLVHVAAHTRLRRDNPMWSTIELVDGPLMLHQIAHQPWATAPLVVLSTCESAVGAGAPGAMMPGLAAALLEIGAGAVVASISLLPDHPTTCSVIADLHRGLADGIGPAAALAATRVAHPDSLAAIALTSWGRG